MRMAVPGAERSKSACIDRHPKIAALPNHAPGRRKHLRFRRAFVFLLPLLYRPHPPERLLKVVIVVASPLRAAEKPGARGKCRAPKLVPQAIGEKNPAPVVVPDRGKAPLRTHHCDEILGHSLQRWTKPFRPTAQDIVQKEKIQRIDVIIRRLLEVGAVLLRLSLQFCSNYPRTQFNPARGAGKTRK